MMLAYPGYTQVVRFTMLRPAHVVDRSPIMVHAIISAAARLGGSRPDEIRGPSRRQSIFRLRAAIALVATRRGKTLSALARALGGRDHTTVRSALLRAERLEITDPEFARFVERLEASL